MQDSFAQIEEHYSSAKICQTDHLHLESQNTSSISLDTSSNNKTTRQSNEDSGLPKINPYI